MTPRTFQLQADWWQNIRQKMNADRIIVQRGFNKMWILDGKENRVVAKNKSIQEFFSSLEITPNENITRHAAERIQEIHREQEDIMLSLRKNATFMISIEKQNHPLNARFETGNTEKILDFVEQNKSKNVDTYDEYRRLASSMESFQRRMLVPSKITSAHEKMMASEMLEEFPRIALEIQQKIQFLEEICFLCKENIDIIALRTENALMIYALNGGIPV